MIDSNTPKTIPGKIKELKLRMLAGTQAYSPEQLLTTYMESGEINIKKLCSEFEKSYESSHDKKFIDNLFEAAFGITLKEFLDICTYGD